MSRPQDQRRAPSPWSPQRRGRQVRSTMIVPIRARPFHPRTPRYSTAIPSDKLGQESAEIGFFLPRRTSVIPIAWVAKPFAVWALVFHSTKNYDLQHRGSLCPLVLLVNPEEALVFLYKF